MKILYLLALLFAVAACGEEKLSDAEQTSMDAVVEFYGGHYSWKKTKRQLDGKSQSCFELEYKGSELIERYADKIEMPATNIAYQFYTGLGAEKSNYELIKVTFRLNDKSVYSKSISTQELDEVAEFTPFLGLLEQLMHVKDYNNIWALFDPVVQEELSEESLRDFFHASDSTCGAFRALQLHGYRFYTDQDNQRAMLHLACVAVRSKENTPLSLFFDQEKKVLVGMNEQF